MTSGNPAWTHLKWYCVPKKKAGLPDVLVSNQKSQFGYIFEGLRLENVDIFYYYFEYFRDIWDIS
jgi:hypothetical protein